MSETEPTPVSIKLKLPNSEQRLKTINTLAEAINTLSKALNDQPHVFINDNVIYGAPNTTAIEISSKVEPIIKNITIPLSEEEIN